MEYNDIPAFNKWWSETFLPKIMCWSSYDRRSAYEAWAEQEAEVERLEAQLAEKPLRSEADAELITAMDKHIAELDERLRVQDQWRKELEAKVERLARFQKAVRNAYYAPPMEAAPATDRDHRMVSRDVCKALAALEGK